MTKCNKCKKNIEKDFDFCPYCGKKLDANNSWGMLGKNDEFLEENPFENSLFGGGMFNKMIGNLMGNAMKMLEKEFQKQDREINKIKPKQSVQLFINGQRINLQGQQMTPQQNQARNNQMNNQIKNKNNEQQIQKIPSITFSEENKKRFSKLEKTNPQTNIRRLSDRIIYDIEMPDVQSKEDISILSLSNSIEIKAIGKEKAYYKVINIKLPIVDYYLEKGNLVLELGVKN